MRSSPLTRILSFSITLLSAYAIVAYLYIALARFIYPFALAILPNVSWYDGVFKEQNGYHCEPLPARMQLKTVSGARSVLTTVCRKL